MRVKKEQIIDGVMSYVENELIPVIKDKPTQIIASVAAKSIKANKSLADSLLDKPMVQQLLEMDENGYYEIDNLFDAIMESVRQYGPFPLELPSIPILSPDVKILKFSDSDIEEMKRRIERSSSYDG